MKRLIFAGLTLLMAICFSGCMGGDTQSTASEEPSALSSLPEPEPSSLPEPESSDVSSEPDDSEQVSTAAVRRESFSFAQNGKNYQVYYPVFLGLRNSEVLNAAMKEAAMREVEESGYLVEIDPITKEVIVSTVQTDYELARQNGEFVSVLFIIETGRSDVAHPSSFTRAVNFDLKSGNVLTAEQILKQDDELYEIVWEAVRDNAPLEVAQYLTAEDIAQNMAETSVYMTPDGIGFALPLPHALGDYYQAVVPYWELQDYLLPGFAPTEKDYLSRIEASGKILEELDKNNE